MPLAVVRHDDGRVTWSGSDVVFGEVTRANPNFGLVPEALATEVLVTGGQVTGVRVRDMRTGDEHLVRARLVVVAGHAPPPPPLPLSSPAPPPPPGPPPLDPPHA